MSKMDKKLIRYTDRNFNTIKESLVNYAKRYHPNVYQDFSEASFGSLMLDTVSYVGDVLSFYLDYQANEGFIETAIEDENILKIGRQMGYKNQGPGVATGLVQIFIEIPANADGTPNTQFA